MHDQKGFALVEAMRVVAVLATATAIALPRLTATRPDATQAVVIATLNQIHRVQEICRRATLIDVDADGRGEYAFFGEMAGICAARAGTQSIQPPLLSAPFGAVAFSRVMQAGYLFQIYLPDAWGFGVPETAIGGDPANTQGVDPDLAEHLWCCYAWPATLRRRQPAFFANQSGPVLATDLAVVHYARSWVTPHYSAAFLAGSTLSLADKPAAGSLGADGNRWYRVQ